MPQKIFSLLMLAAVSALAQAPKITPAPSPAPAGSLQPNWSTTPDGNALLSWVQPSKDDSYALYYAVLQGSTWSAPHTVATNRHFFRHPAEVPEVQQLGPKEWMAHWVEMPNEGNEAEYVYVSSSTDGVHWSAPVMAHKDRSAVEHGLASMAMDAKGEISVLWLETPQGEDGPGYLMRTVVDPSGKEIKEEKLDGDVCNCCPTATARTAKGLLVAYRARTPQDIRDIAVTRLENGHWSPSKVIHADGWHLNACPTNAATVSAKGDHVAVAWFTGAQNSPRVEIAFSGDDGATFGKTTVVSTGHAFGYASVALTDDGGALVSWLEQGGKEGALALARLVSLAGVLGPVVRIAEGGKMALGYPRVIHTASGNFVAWGDGQNGGKMSVARIAQ